jgi:hypothetical protein
VGWFGKSLPLVIYVEQRGADCEPNSERASMTSLLDQLFSRSFFIEYNWFVEAVGVALKVEIQ